MKVESGKLPGSRSILVAILAIGLVASACSSEGTDGDAARASGPASTGVTNGDDLTRGPLYAQTPIGKGSTLDAILDGSQMHLTFFDRHGEELPVETVSIHAASDGASKQLRLLRFGAGHFVATVALEPGRWDFSVGGMTGTGDPIDGSFTFDVPGS